MKTYSFGQTPQRLIRSRLPLKYPMELNKTDMLNLLYALKIAAMNVDEDFSDWAFSMRTSILETIDIEEL